MHFMYILYTQTIIITNTVINTVSELPCDAVQMYMRFYDLIIICYGKNTIIVT